ncbi:hypothetical protein Q7526_01795 [Glaesserella parasuis]|uniref:hypothetical protein n=1 Tax=Glaesserella parasuis TaxID=738 RepID=UPI002436BC0C|nr:hypothetical protein [Glaesserella parasuis]MDG6361312.1 hypothetical protein [Glaesserella parasuis]MDO9795959.1 hypothetical protein [Glaesserella parasuis]MDO9813326.1 hypothetical protein [Glaesserella parasuis]MDP0340527.1 hypothetical protein [Glaesserella parasuis]MDP0356795.1 hypothetical protein [Glaesserella parasuis]
MQKTSLHILWIYPLLTQLLGSALLPLFSEFSQGGMLVVFALFTVPAFLFALVSYKQQYHQRNIIQIAFFSGVIMFIYSLFSFSLMLAFDEYTSLEDPIPLWEQSLAVILFALTFALAKAMYALLVLRLFLPKV